MSDAAAVASELPPLRVVIDTNVWVSAFINPHGAPAQLRFAWYSNQFSVITSLPMVEELAEVLSRPRLLRD